MCAKWLQKTYPIEIIKSLDSSRVKKENTVVGFNAFTFDEDVSSLLSFIRFDPRLPACEEMQLFRKSAFVCAKRGRITARSLISEIARRETLFLKTPLSEGILVTQFSVRHLSKLGRFTVGDSKLSFKKRLPKRFDRDSILATARHGLVGKEPEDYTWVLVRTSGRSILETGTKGLAAAGVVRGLWNLFFNLHAIMRLSGGGRPKPVNQILRGPFHTLHRADGSPATDRMWWYEPDYVGPVRAFDLTRRWGKFGKFVVWSLRRIRESRLHDHLAECVTRYGDALDERRYQNAFLQLWSVLEALTGTQNADYGSLVRRGCFIWEDRDRHQQVLEHLRERRNRLIHSTSPLPDAEIVLYQLKRYCEEIILFLLKHPGDFGTVEELRQFMDTSADVKELRRRIAVLDTSRRFREGKWIRR